VKASRHCARRAPGVVSGHRHRGVGRAAGKAVRPLGEAGPRGPVPEPAQAGLCDALRVEWGKSDSRAASRWRCSSAGNAGGGVRQPVTLAAAVPPCQIRHLHHQCRARSPRRCRRRAPEPVREQRHESAWRPVALSLGIYGGHVGQVGHISRTILGLLEADGVGTQDVERRLWAATSLRALLSHGQNIAGHVTRSLVPGLGS